MAQPPKKSPARTIGLNGKRLKAVREGRGMTQVELSWKAKTALPGLSAAENGHKDLLGAGLKRICLALDVSSDYLLDLSDSLQRRK